MRFLRYPGGKSKLLSFLITVIVERNQIGRYIEPFVGGGSVFLHLQPKGAILADINRELIELYKGIRNYPHKVWEIFESFPSGKEAYYRIRNDEYYNKPLFYRAARSLYLNRTCFKGMWRHSPEGVFSVGYGGEQRRWVITHKDLIELSKRFRKALILHEDFEPVLDQCRDGDFIFLDPPYKPGEKELFEAHYAYGRFSYEDQIRLSNKLKELSERKKVKWLLTNSSNSEICRLYHDFNIMQIPKGTSSILGVHTIDSKEVVISNYRAGG